MYFIDAMAVNATQSPFIPLNTPKDSVELPSLMVFPQQGVRQVGIINPDRLDRFANNTEHRQYHCLY